MGTRADFYVGKGESAEWIGSIAWDGYPDGIDRHVFAVVIEAQYREAITEFFTTCDSATLPDKGWPWPWTDSRTTDYAYAFDDGRVWASCFGRAWFDPLKPPEDHCSGAKTESFPDMTSRTRVTLGPRSGVIVLSS